MFFPKLRRKAKWVFAFLAVAFALSFVVAGVGTGFGSGFGDYLAELFNRQPGSGDQVSLDEARGRVAKNPKDPKAQLALATAAGAEQKTDEAIAALVAYKALKPKDQDALRQLAGLYLAKASDAEQRASEAQQRGAEAFFGSEVTNPASKVSQAVGVAPLTQSEQQDVSQAYSTALTEAQDAYTKEAAVWKELTELNPEDSSYFFELGRSSQQSNNAAQAITAFETYLRLAPNDVNAPQVRQLVKQLKAQKKNGGPPGLG